MALLCKYNFRGFYDCLQPLVNILQRTKARLTWFETNSLNRDVFLITPLDSSEMHHRNFSNKFTGGYFRLCASDYVWSSKDYNFCFTVRNAIIIKTFVSPSHSACVFANCLSCEITFSNSRASSFSTTEDNSCKSSNLGGCMCAP